MVRYIIREGTVRGQGRYWSLAVEAGRGVCFWDYGDPIVYEDRDLAHKAAGTVGGRVVRLITKAERAVRGHEATIGRLSEDLRAARAARADLFSALSRVEASRDEARTMLGQLQLAYSAAVSVVVKTGHHRTTPVLAEAVSLIVAERDEARAKLAEAWCERDEARTRTEDLDDDTPAGAIATCDRCAESKRCRDV